MEAPGSNPLKGVMVWAKVTSLVCDSEFYHEQIGRSYSSDRYSFSRKRPLAVAAMNAELAPFKNGEHNSESASTMDHVVTPLKQSYGFGGGHLRFTLCVYFIAANLLL